MPVSTRNPLIFHFAQPHLCNPIHIHTNHSLLTNITTTKSQLQERTLHNNTTRTTHLRTASSPAKIKHADPTMTDFIPADEMKPEFVEFEKANRVVIEDPDDFESWEKLVRIAETLEGGLNRNSSPQAIALTRGVFDRFLAKFPLLFGYWKKYADMEFSIAGTEAAEMVSAGMTAR